MNALDYFKQPFPSAQGFSAYRMPGVILHVPFLLGCVALGLGLCWEPAWLLALLPIYVLVGIYGGRDLALAAHYNLWLLLAGLLALLSSSAWVPWLWQELEYFSLQQRLELSLALAIGFGWHVSCSLRRMAE